MFRTVSLTRAELKQDVQQHFESAYRAFLAVDVNRDGHIEVEEFERILAIYNLPVEHAQGLLTRADKNGDGTLDYAEFCKEFFGAPSPAKARAPDMLTSRVARGSALTPVSTNQGDVPSRPGAAKDLGNRLRQHYKNAAKAFLKLDKDRTGFVEAEEIRSIEREYNMPVGELMSTCDENGDGRLSYDEVAKYIFAR